LYASSGVEGSKFIGIHTISVLVLRGDFLFFEPFHKRDGQHLAKPPSIPDE
jgi:hypothetical protein